MSNTGETFFTVVGCMDGRVQTPLAEFGAQKFGAKFPDTITEAGIVGLIANKPEPKFIENLKFKLLVSIEKHHSRGILVAGHQECAGNPVDDEIHKEEIRKSVQFIRSLTENKTPITGVFVIRENSNWQVQQV